MKKEAGKAQAKPDRMFTKGAPTAIAEVMGAGNDLVKVCEAADGGDACPVLAAWDKTSNVGSRGNQIFEEFVTRLPTVPLTGARISVRDRSNAARSREASAPATCASSCCARPPASRSHRSSRSPVTPCGRRGSVVRTVRRRP